MLGTPTVPKLWQRQSGVLSPKFQDNVVFNPDAGDNDFTIKKQSSGDAYTYDAGLDVHTFNGEITGNATANAAIGIDNADYVLTSTWNNNSAGTMYGAVISAVSNANNASASRILTLTYAKPTRTEVFSVDTLGTIQLIANNGSGVQWGSGGGHIKLVSNTLESRGYNGFQWETNLGDKMKMFQGGNLQLGGTFGGQPSELLQVNGDATIIGQSDSVQFTVKGNATQTSNLQEWQNSAGTTLASLNNTGRFTPNHIYMPNAFGVSLADSGTYLYTSFGYTVLNNQGGNGLRLQKNGVDILQLDTNFARVMQEATFNYNFTDDDFIINKNASGVAYKYDAGLDTHTWSGDVFFTDGVLQVASVRDTKVTSSATETISVETATYIDIDTSGNTLTLSDMVDGSRMQIHNSSSGDATLAFAIKVGTTTFSSPITMPSGDSYELVYDSGSSVWVM